MTTDVCWCLHALRFHSGPEGECMFFFDAPEGQPRRRCTCPYFEAKT